MCVSDYQGLDWRKNFGHKSAGWCKLWSDHPSFISHACFSLLQMSKDFLQHTLLMIYIIETYHYHRNNAILISNVLKSFLENTVLNLNYCLKNMLHPSWMQERPYQVVRSIPPCKWWAQFWLMPEFQTLVIERSPLQLYSRSHWLWLLFCVKYATTLLQSHLSRLCLTLAVRDCTMDRSIECLGIS